MKTALVGRFGEEAPIQTSLKNQFTLEQSKNNKLQSDLLALRRDYKLLSDKFIIKKWVQDMFMRVMLKGEQESNFNHRLGRVRLETTHEYALEDVVKDYEWKMEDVNALYERKMEGVKASH